MTASASARDRAPFGPGLPTEPGTAIEIPPPPPLARGQWLRALRSLRKLLADPDDTEKAIEVIYALGRRSFERSFQRFAAAAAGRRLLAERPSLRAALSDARSLGGLPRESFGAAYARYLAENGFAPDGLLQLQERARPQDVPELDPLRDWFRERTVLLHDLWHVLTDYGTDPIGETAQLWFSVGQDGGPSEMLLGLGAALRSRPEGGPGFLRYLCAAHRRGRRTPWLVPLRYEELLPRPLEQVRLLARIVPTGEAHRDGVRRGAVAVVTPRRRER